MALLSPSDEERIKRYEEILAKEPGAIIFAVLGSLYARKYEFDKAIEVLSKGVENYPNYFSARILLGKCYLAKDDVDGAVREFSGILELDLYNVPTLNLLGDVLRDTGRYEEAGERYKKILEIEPENTDVQYKLHLLEQLTEIPHEMPGVGDVSETEIIAHETREEEEGLATVTLAEVYAEQGLLDKAASIINRVVQDHPDDEDVREVYERIQRLIDSESELMGESVLVIVDQVAAIRGLMEEDELDLWYEAQRGVAEAVSASGVSFTTLLHTGPSYSTTGETVLTVDGVAGNPGVFRTDTIEIHPAVAELLMVEFELERTLSASPVTESDEFAFEDTYALEPSAETESRPADDAGSGEPIDDSAPSVGIGRVTAETPAVEEQVAEIETETVRPGDNRRKNDENGPPSTGSIVKPEMYIPREVKKLEDDPFGEDDEFLGWLNSIKLRDL
jgi:tetratricopeptide (TPR) repeat protein